MPLAQRVIRRIRRGRNGVGGPPPPNTVIDLSPAPTTLVNYRTAPAGTRYRMTIIGTTTGSAWGTDTYTDDSAIATAAVHAGFAAVNGSATVIVETVAPLGSYLGSTRRGVTTRSWGSWPWAYRFVGTPSLPPVPTYSLAAFEGNFPITYANEGTAIRFRLTTTNVANGTYVPFTISGVQTQDISPSVLSGNFVVNNNVADYSVVVLSDYVQGETETITLTLSNGAAALSVPIRDTTPTFRLTASTSVVSEGQTLTITLTTTNVANGSNIAYTILSPQAADVRTSSVATTPHPMSGSFNIQNNVGTQSFYFVNDSLTEGNEVFTLRLTSGQAAISVTISDTSRAPVLPPPPPRPPVVPPTNPIGIPTPTNNNMTLYRAPPYAIGTRFRFNLTGAINVGTVWGTDTYTDDSSLAQAAVHCGALTNGQTGVVTVELVPSLTQYIGSVRNGVRTSSWGSWPWAYKFVASPRLPAPIPPRPPQPPAVITATAVIYGNNNVRLPVLATYNASGIASNMLYDLRNQRAWAEIANGIRHIEIFVNNTSAISWSKAALPSNIQWKPSSTAVTDYSSFLISPNWNTIPQVFQAGRYSRGRLIGSYTRRLEMMYKPPPGPFFRLYDSWTNSVVYGGGEDGAMWPYYPNVLNRSTPIAQPRWFRFQMPYPLNHIWFIWRLR